MKAVYTIRLVIIIAVAYGIMGRPEVINGIVKLLGL